VPADAAAHGGLPLDFVKSPTVRAIAGVTVTVTVAVPTGFSGGWSSRLVPSGGDEGAVQVRVGAVHLDGTAHSDASSPLRWFHVKQCDPLVAHRCAWRRAVPVLT
jgi:hypothetical protein